MTSFYENDPIVPVVQQHITQQEAKSKEGKEIKNNYLSFFIGLAVVLLLLFTLYSNTDGGKTWGLSSLFLLVFTLLWIFIFVIAIIQSRIEKTVALLMKTNTSNIAGKPAAGTDTDTENTGALLKPAFQLDVYEENELPEHQYILNKPLTDSHNIFNLSPLRIFYFCNFYSVDSLRNKTSGGWRRHGTVYYLGSPKDIGYRDLYRMMSIKKIVSRLLIPTPEKLNEAIDKADQKPIPPKTKGLQTDDYFDGAYPANVFYCTDSIWQEAVQLLFTKTDIALIDCCDYTTDRSGLSWEIGQIINHIATEDFIVLINGNTDLPALGGSFKTAWHKMRSDSPNNRENPCPVRFVFHQTPGDSSANAPLHKNIFLELYHRQTLANDKIIALLLKTAQLDTSLTKTD